MTKLALLVFVVGCSGGSGGPFEPQPDSTIAFAPTETTFERFASQCGVMNPPFQPTDLFSLSLLGADDPGVARTDIHLSFENDLPLHTPIGVMLQPFGVTATSTDASGHTTQFFGQNGTIDAGADSTFGWSQGADVNEVDPGPLSSVSVQVDAMPADEGALGDFLIDMTFADGAVLDFRVAHAIHTGFSGCPAG